MNQTRPKSYILLSCPRTASNLLMRILNLDEQPGVASAKHRDYFFVDSLKWQVGDALCCKPLRLWSQPERDGLFATYQAGFQTLQAVVQDGETQGKDIFVKEHVNFMIDPVAWSKLLHGAESIDEKPWTVNTDFVSPTHTEKNPTVLPDEALKTWLPTLLIRHPALVFPSFQRVSMKVYGETKSTTEEIFTLGTTLHWSRMIYDWFSDLHKSGWPIVLDADDFITEPEVVKAYARVAGLDSTKLKFAWDAITEEVRNLMPHSVQTMGASLFASRGVVKTESPKDINISEEAKKWRQEFGDDVASNLERRVRDAMPDYEYLRSKRFTERL